MKKWYLGGVLACWVLLMGGGIYSSWDSLLTQTFLPNEPQTELFMVDTPRKLPLPIPPEPKSENEDSETEKLVADTCPEIKAEDWFGFRIIDADPSASLQIDADGSVWRSNGKTRKRLYEKVECNEIRFVPVIFDLDYPPSPLGVDVEGIPIVVDWCELRCCVKDDNEPKGE